MDKQQWKKISRIIDLALTMPPEQRTTYIQELCAGKPELQQEVNELLESLEGSEGFLDEQIEKNKALFDDLATQLEETIIPGVDDNLEGSIIDQWKLTELLGHGGMGSVYKVERLDSEIRQIGALKIMHQNLKTPENVERFKLEQQILAGLNHPNISSRIDGGINDRRLPYLVMEYVEGKPILEYCDSHQLTIKQRLQLFAEVCKAVQYAHKNLIVHRDLKPQNILVTGEGYIKVMDFGIAKLLDPDSYDFSAIETRQGAGLMSLESAAPEQVSGDPITTSTDLYALGILLYKLLAGVHPLDFEDKQYRKIMQMIREEPTPSPSKRIRHLTDEKLSPGIIKSRGMKISELAKILEGDLDAIVLKALRKEPDARYNSVGQLVDDIDAYLGDKPVMARGETFQYRTKKFFKRHTKGLTATAVFILVVISLVSYYTFRLTEERNIARLEANKAEQVKNLLIDIFQSGNPFSSAADKDIAVREVLDRGTKQIRQKLDDQPLVQAELMEALGNVYIGLVSFPEGEPLLRKALATYKEELGENHPDVARASHLLGFLLLRNANYEEAESLYEQSKQIYEANFGKQDPNYAYSLKMLAHLYSETGRKEKALKLYNQAIEIYEDKDSKAIAGTLSDLGYLLMDLGRYEKAISTLNRSIAIFKEEYQGPHPNIANSLSGIAQVSHRKGEISKAEQKYRHVLKMRKRIFPENHTHIAASRLRLGWVLVEQNRIREAIPMVQKAYKSFKSQLPAKSWKIAASEGVLALAWIGQGKFQQAEDALLNTYEVFKNQFGKNDWRTNNAKLTLAKLYSEWGKPNMAANYLKK